MGERAVRAPARERQDFALQIAPLSFAHLFGYLVLALGLYILYVIVVEPQATGTAAWAVAPPMVLFGGLLAFLRTGTRSSLRRDELVEWWGVKLPLLPPLVLKREVDRLASFAEVRLVAATVRTDEGFTTVHAVELARAEGQPGRTLQKHGSFQAARRLAERVARGLQLPLRDATRGDGVVRMPHELDRAVRDEVASAEMLVSTPPPPGARARLETSGGGLLIHVPPVGLRAKDVGPVVVWGVVICAFFLYQEGGWPREATWVVAALAAVAAIGLLSKARRRWRIEVTRDALRIQRCGGALWRTAVIPASEVEELLAKGDGVEVRTDRRIVRFGDEHLAPGEDAYLVAAIRSFWAAAA